MPIRISRAYHGLEAVERGVVAVGGVLFYEFPHVTLISQLVGQHWDSYHRIAKNSLAVD